eukprot:Lithocolla_globosa_v1_NODE_6881_length_1022_cov_7.415719.p2 type:complete len:130 gc:universal NODE_6881_length_1022_cov_7.415719:594-205(-)
MSLWIFVRLLTCAESSSVSFFNSALSSLDFLVEAAFRLMFSNFAGSERANCGWQNSQASSPYSRLLLSECLILWKSYLLSCLTKLAKLLCLKWRGKTPLANSFVSFTTNASPLSTQLTMLSWLLSFNIR